MIGILDCRTQSPGQNWAGQPLEMLEFFDRPLLQHAVEQMVQSGITHCVLIAEDTSAVMQRWGEGERWGCTFSAIPPRAITSFLAGLGDALLMVGRGDCIPCISGLQLHDQPVGQVQLVFTEDEGEGVRRRVFTGWAVAAARSLLGACFATSGANGLLELAGTSALQVTTCVRCSTPAEFLKSQNAVLAAVEATVIFHGMEQRPGVWMTRNAVLHPSVKVIGRVYLGENVRVQAGVTLVGPVVVCRDSVVAEGAVVSDASIQPGTFVGPSLHLKQDVVFPGAVARAREGLLFQVDDARKLADTRLSLWSYIRLLYQRANTKAA